jgi:quinol-cytochrome oxidoreductase complex cytochrome b subunit
MMATAFIGYVLPWGYKIMAQNGIIYSDMIVYFYSASCINDLWSSGKPKIPTIKRIGPHNWDVISVLIGGLLGDVHGE